MGNSNKSLIFLFLRPLPTMRDDKANTEQMLKEQEFKCFWKGL